LPKGVRRRWGGRGQADGAQRYRGVVIVVKSLPGDRLSALLGVRRRVRELGLGGEVPLDLKLVTVEEFEELRRRGFFRKVVEVGTG